MLQENLEELIASIINERPGMIMIDLDVSPGAKQSRVLGVDPW